MNADDQDRYEMIAHLVEQGLTIIKKSGVNITFNDYREYVVQNAYRGCDTFHDGIEAAKAFMELK